MASAQDHRRSEQGILSAFFEHSPTCLVLLNRDFDFLRVNAAYAHACRRPIADFAGKNHFELYPSPVIEDFRRVVREKTAWSASGRPFVFPDHPEWGTTYWDLSLMPLLDEHGGVEFLILSLHDVTPIVRAERELLASQARYQQLFELSPAGILIHDEARYLQANPRAARMLGYDGPEELVGLALEAPIHPDDRARVRRGAATIAEERAVGSTSDLRMLRKDGSVLLVQANVGACEFGGRPAVQVILSDMTERRKLEEELRQAQKMESIGRLAGGVAHDFNNLLTVINAYADLAIRSTAATPQLRADLTEVRKAGERAAELTKQLLAFSRRQVLQPAKLRVHDVLVETKSLLRRLLPENIELTLAGEREQADVFVDRGQLEQVVMNLAVNARDAMLEHGGRLELATEEVEVTAGEASAHDGLIPGRYVKLRVADNGCGMDARTKAHIFEPFFTTKELGKGTGLGLATVHGIVHQSGGSIMVESEPRRGTTFDVFLPIFVSIPPTSPTPPARPRTSRATTGRETILLVEDEAAVRAVVHRGLEEAGYTVLTAADAEEALRVAASTKDVVHLLLTDILLPRGRGNELAAQLAIERPGIRVLFMSGYVDDETLEHAILPAHARLLSKPIVVDELLQGVRAALDEAPERAVDLA